MEGFTLACGTGAVASTIIFSERKKVISPTFVTMPGGTVVVSHSKHYQEVFIEGPVTLILEGEYLWKEF